MEPASRHHTMNPPDAPQAGDQRAFEILVRQHHRRLMGYAISLCRQEDAAKDIVQDAFVIAWTNLEKFDVTRDFGAWMRGIVRNKWKEWVRRQDFVGVEEDFLDALESRHQQWDAADTDGGEDVMGALERCRRKLPDLLADVVQRFYFERQSGARTAELVGADPATVRKRLQRARQQLGLCIESSLRKNPSL